MTATVNQAGQIILPPGAAAEARLQPGGRFDLMISTSGNILLRPKRRRTRSLTEHFKALRGLEIKSRRDAVPDPPTL